jgi:glycosyltransferase involved in cell wall biosynthesis
MKIVYLASGAGGMYCGSCLSGNTLAAAMICSGHDVLQVPVYTPLRTDEEDVSVDRVMFGGLNVYLQQKSALFRHTPWFLDRLLDRPGLLGWLGRRSVSMRPRDLGPLTVSMLRGEDGRQRKELEKLVRWLAGEIRPEVVHLSNVLLAGMARRIGDALGVPVVANLGGEDIFLEQLPDPHYSEAREQLSRRCGDLAALVAMNGYFADFMAGYLAVDRQRIDVIPPGLNLQGHAVPDSDVEIAPTARSAWPADGTETVTIGYLARICPDKGLHLLAEALKTLAADAELPPIRIRAAGYLGPGDRGYLKQIETELGQSALLDRFEYVGELSRAEKIAFLGTLDVMSVPTVYRESKGLPALEAWANGVPTVLPDHGAFPEMTEDTGGGLLHEPDDPAALAKALKRLIRSPGEAVDMGRKAQRAVHDRYHAELAARRTVAWYRRVLSQPNHSSP